MAALPQLVAVVRLGGMNSRFRWCLIAANLGAAFAAGWFGALATTPQAESVTPQAGSVADVFARVRVGMSLRQAVGTLDSIDPSYIDCFYYRGLTKDGRPFSGCCDRDLPEADKIARGELELMTEQDGSVLVYLG